MWHDYGPHYSLIFLKIANSSNKYLKSCKTYYGNNTQKEHFNGTKPILMSLEQYNNLVKWLFYLSPVYIRRNWLNADIQDLNPGLDTY